MNRQDTLKRLRRELRNGQHLLGVSTGSGMMASQAARGGADFIMALNSGRFRTMGRSSLAGFLPFENSNQEVFRFASKELLPLLPNLPIVFGLNATDPLIDLPDFIKGIKDGGFSGVNNYPTIGLIDGQFAEALEEEGLSYQAEVRAIAEAHRQDLFTIAFVFNESQGKAMTRAGADVICFHCGLTRGGKLGAKKVITLEAVIKQACSIFRASREIRQNVMTMIYGGPVNDLVDSQYIYNHLAELDGYIGGSTFDRITPAEAVIEKTKHFKHPQELIETNLMAKMLDGIEKHYDYVEFVKKYIKQNYGSDIQLDDLAKVAHISSSYLSTLFKEKTGSTFTEYLIKYRLNQAVQLLSLKPSLKLKEVANLVGYQDYAQFNKIFKRYMGLAPRDYKAQNI